MQGLKTDCVIIMSEEKFHTLKAAIEEGLSSGISNKTVEDIRNDVLKRLRKHISTAIKKGGSYSDKEIGEALANDKGKEEKSTKQL